MAKIPVEAKAPPTATVYVLAGVLAVDCDVCHEALLTSPVVACGSQWIQDSLLVHTLHCPGSPTKKEH